MEQLETMLEELNWNIAIVIADFNGWEQTRTCLETLSGALGRRMFVQLVAHGTNDESTKNAEYLNHVNVLTESPSLWWTGATNRGISNAIQLGASHIMLLNNDAYFAREEIEKLVAHFFRHSIDNLCLLAPIQRDLSSKKAAPYKIKTLLELGFTTYECTRRESTGDTERLYRTKLIQGGRGVLVPTEIFRKIGLFDEDLFPHYLADHDFYLRCNQNDIPLYIATDSEVLIDSERSTVAGEHKGMNLATFLSTLKDKRSHKNIKTVLAFYKKHSKNFLLMMIGISLFYIRHFTLFLHAKAKSIFR